MPTYIIDPKSGDQTELPDNAALVLPPFHSGDGPGALQANKFVFIVWMVVLGLLGVTIILFGFLAFLSRDDAATSAWLMAPATTALGAVVGLLAPTPAKK
jgi:hypothetical protein